MVAVVGTPGVLAGCNRCDYLLEGVADPALPEPTDFHDVALILDLVGASELQVANAIRSNTKLSSSETLSLVRSERPIIARRPNFLVRELEELQMELSALGATSTIHRMP